MSAYDKMIDKRTLDRVDNLIHSMVKDMEELKRRLKDLEDKLSRLENK